MPDVAGTQASLGFQVSLSVWILTRKTLWTREKVQSRNDIVSGRMYQFASSEDN